MQFSFYNGTVVHCENVWVNTGTHWVPSFHLGLGHLVQSMQITALGWVTRPKKTSGRGTYGLTSPVHTSASKYIPLDMGQGPHIFVQQLSNGGHPMDIHCIFI